MWIGPCFIYLQAGLRSDDVIYIQYTLHIPKAFSLLRASEFQIAAITRSAHCTETDEHRVPPPLHTHKHAHPRKHTHTDTPFTHTGAHRQKRMHARTQYTYARICIIVHPHTLTQAHTGKHAYTPYQQSPISIVGARHTWLRKHWFPEGYLANPSTTTPWRLQVDWSVFNTVVITTIVNQSQSAFNLIGYGIAWAGRTFCILLQQFTLGDQYGIAAWVGKR